MFGVSVKILDKLDLWMVWFNWPTFKEAQAIKRIPLVIILEENLH